VVLLSPSRQRRKYYLDYAKTAFFQILSSLSSSSHYTICIITLDILTTSCKKSHRIKVHNWMIVAANDEIRGGYVHCQNSKVHHRFARSTLMLQFLLFLCLPYGCFPNKNLFVFSAYSNHIPADSIPTVFTILTIICGLYARTILSLCNILCLCCYETFIYVGEKFSMQVSHPYMDESQATFTFLVYRIERT
jgi:hypothetical protein